MLSWRTPAISGIIGGSSLARANPALVLPVPRRFQSSQAVEVPLVRRLKSGPPAGRQLPPWRTKRQDYIRISPSAVILERLYTRGSRMTREQWELFQEIAQNRSTRLPVMTAQMLLRQEEVSLRTSLSNRLTDDDGSETDKSWDERLAMLAHTGITENHLQHWVWILQGKTADERVQRFLSGDTYKPVFLLFIMIDKNHSILDRQLFMSLLEYVSTTYCQPPSQAAQPQTRHRSLSSYHNMTPVHFIEMLRRLVDQALRLCPEALVTTAETITSYLKTRPVSPNSHDNGYAAQCLVFNRALELLSRPSYLRPLANIKHNWEAQKHLLAFSTSLKRPLIINEAGYRAIQSVMVAREKSEDEEKVAVRSAKSWPPYREAWDGVDERRRPQDDLSRAVRAGILAREAGYPDAELDRALGAVGGAVLGDGPTIHTRSRPPPRPVGGRRAAENVYGTWAARVRATRNAQEAWALFRRPPEEGIRPSAWVYAEMFAKLLAHEVADPASAVPGNAREVLPVYHPGNLSEFEKWRLQPPTVGELYDDMLRAGVRPVGQVLRLLVANANSEREVLRYLEDSPYQEFAAAVRNRDASCPPTQAKFFKVERVYRSVPRSVFGAYISFLCKMQRKAYSAAHSPEQHHVSSRVDNSYLRRALAVVSVRLRPETAEGRTYKPPWYDILRTLVLARTHGALVTVARRQMGLFLDVFKWVRTHTGMDAVLLEIMCLSVGRVMAANFAKAAHGAGVHSKGVNANGTERWWVRRDAVGGDEGRRTLARARADAVAAFEEMKKPGSGMGGFHLYSYVRVLGMYGAMHEMVEVMRWVLARLEEGNGFDGGNEDGTSSHAYLMRAFGFVEAYGKECGYVDDVASLKARLRLLAEEGYPFALGAMSEREKEDVQYVKAIAEGWERHAEDGVDE